MVSEPLRAGSFLVSEVPSGTLSRDQITILAVNDGATYYNAGQVLGRQVIGSKAAFANVAGDTGNGTCGTITLSAGVLEGVYTGQFITAGTTAQFQLEGPGGVPLVDGKVGTAYSNGGLAFTLTTGGTNYAIGDEFTITVGTATFANGGSDTGNGTCSAIVVSTGVIGGVYTFTATSATVFTAVDPFGTVLPNLTVGSQYNAGGLQFTVTAGGSAYVVGDTFTVTTFTGSDLYVPVNASAADGSQYAAAILWSRQYMGGATNVKAAAVTRNAEVAKTLLGWPSGATDDQIRNWTTQLAALGIIARKSA